MDRRRLRYAVIGIGAGIFKSHQKALQSSPDIELVAGADVNAETGQKRAHELNCAFYTDYRQLLNEVKPDVAVVITPHAFHASIALDCLRSGAHTLVEKPMALQVKDADLMIATADEVQRLLGVVTQHRFRPEIRAAHKLLQEQKLGTIQRASLTAVWPRPESYFKLASWRGTWKGEGGGVLMNQAAHNLDLLCHLAGMPKRLAAWTKRQVHQIETEDTVQAMLEWESGAMGSLHISTAETGISEKIEIVGTGGRLEIMPGKITVQLLDVDFLDYAKNSRNPFEAPTEHTMNVELLPGIGDHSAVYRCFNDAIHQGNTDFLVNGRQGRMSLELANALIYAGQTNNPVEFPLNREKYAQLLQQLQQG